MIRDTKRLSQREYDVIVIGGGIFGVCTAWEAASRGLSVALLEKHDFSHATSANSYKIVHGGMRYLQHLDLYRVRESSRERSALLRIAPHLVHPLPVVMPTYGHGLKGKELLRAGFLVYDVVTWDRNRGIADPTRRIPRARFLSREGVLDLFPHLNKEGLTGAAVFHDGQMYNPPRLALAFLRSAVDAGAEVANYCEVVRFLRLNGRVVGVEAHDRILGTPLEIRGRIVVNSAGPWAARLAEDGLGAPLKERPQFSRDVGLVVRRRLSDKFGLACATATKDAETVLDRGARHLFLMPWRQEYTLLGVWHGLYEGSPDRFEVARKELEAFVDEARQAYRGLEATAEDVLMVNTGLILFGSGEQKEAEHGFGRRSLLIDHADRGAVGLISLIGVRATTARGMAERAIDMAFKKLGRSGPRSRTAYTPIFGGAMSSFADCVAAAQRDRPPMTRSDVITPLVHNYGSEYGRVLRYIKNDDSLAETVCESTVLKAEVVHAVREEMALTLEDVVFRRTDLGTGSNPGAESIKRCADLMASELAWDGERVQNEIDKVMEVFSQLGAVKQFE